MSKRNIILILIGVAALAIAGYIVYRGLNGGASTNLLTATGEVSTPAPIFTQGRSLDFGPIQKYNPQPQLFTYPKVNSGETNLTLPNLIK